MTLCELSQADQTAAHRRDFMQWWATTMWAGRSDRWAMLTMDIQLARWLERSEAKREKARVM